jgi:hypothetical protein
MARPRNGSRRKPNTTAIRVKPETKPLINLAYRKLVTNGNPGMAYGDKLDSVLEACLKKLEALEVENLRLQEELDLANVILARKDKRIEEMMISR